jgi:hypothetical protein
LLEQKEKTSGGNPRLYPDTPSFEDCVYPFVEHLQDSETPGESPEPRYYKAILPFGEIVEGIATENLSNTDYSIMDNITLKHFYETKAYAAGLLWMLLHQRSRTDDKTGYLVAEPTTYAWMKEQTGLSKRTLQDQIDKLIDAGFLDCYPSRKMVGRENSKQNGNCYILNYRRYIGKQQATSPVLSVSTYEQPAPTTPTVSIGTRTNVDNSSLGWQKTATPPSGEPHSDTYLFKDLSKDYLSQISQNLVSVETPTADKTSKLASVAQLEALEKHLKQWTAPALRYYGLESLEQLSSSQANSLIKLTQAQNEALRKELSEIVSAMSTEQAVRQSQLDYQAEQERKRFEEIENEAARQAQIAAYGKVLSPQERKAKLFEALKRQGDAK